MGDSGKTVVVQRGVRLTTLLAVLFIGLKLTHSIDWSWVWVLCPLWIGAACWVALILFLIFVAMLGGLLS